MIDVLAICSVVLVLLALIIFLEKCPGSLKPAWRFVWFGIAVLLTVAALPLRVAHEVSAAV
jgi:hypothetical protein